jgi:hypothetical protein
MRNSVRVLAGFAFVFALATAAQAVTSVDGCIPECDVHQLEWRPISADPWASVAAPLPVADIIRSDTGEAARGVEWTGLSSFGEFRATAMRGSDLSPYSPILFLGEPPVAPLLLAALGTVFLLRTVKRR